MSKATDEVLAIETGFWANANDPEYYAKHLAGDGVTVIEPMGFIEKPMAVEAAKHGDPFVKFGLTDVVAREVAPGVVILAYHGQGEHAGKPAYEGSIASVYVLRDGRWQNVLAAHQPRTRADAPAGTKA